MPYCSQCGTQVSERDVFCARCGGRQPGQARPTASADPLATLSPRTASILCYIPAVGWIASVVVLAAERFRGNKVVRFHAFQGLYLFVAWLVEDWVLRPVFVAMPHTHLDSLVKAALLGMSIFMIVKASHEVPFQLPLFGELAQRSVAED